MSNADLLMLLGLGLAATSLAVVIPPVPVSGPRPATAWVPIVLGVLGAAVGLLAFLVVAFR